MDGKLAKIRERFENGGNDGIVDLGGLRLEDEHISAVVEGMKAMGSKLKELRLWENTIGAAGARAVAEALHHCPSLITLRLNSNNIGDAGARAVAEALHHCPSLTGLSLDNNNIGDAGAQAVAEALHHCPSITGLDLGGNNIGDAGARAVAEALHHCPSLTTLWLQRNNISAAGARAVAQILSDRPHPALTWLVGIDLKEHANALRLPAEMANADNNAILSFLRERVEGAGPTRLAIAKVMVTGPGSAGKTCLVQRLVGGDYLRHSVQIDGIAQTSWEEPGATGLQLRYHDFGSEEVYAASHQIVLRTRAVFLVVWSSCEADFEAHLFDVLDASPEAKLLLVCTKQDEGSIPATAEQRSELEEAYGDQIHGFYHVSSRSGAGIDELRRAIVEVAHTLEPMDEEGPSMPS